MQMTPVSFWLVMAGWSLCFRPPGGHHDAWSQALDRRECLGAQRSLAVNRLSQRVDDAAEQLVADGHGDDAAGPLDQIAFLDLRELAEEDRADALFFEVQRDAE